MKKVITICLLALMIIPMAFSASLESTNRVNPEKDFMLEVVSKYDMPLTSRAKGMGGAGIALPGRADAFFMNPAGLAKRGTVLLPSAEVSIYHPYDMLNPGKDGKSLIDSVIEGQQSGDPDAMMGAVEPLLNMIKSGRGKLMDVNASVAFDFAGFAIGAHVSDSLHTFGTGMGGIDSSLFDELNVTANIGLGLRFKIGDSFWIDAGANWRPTYKAYSAAIGATDIMGVIQPKEGEETVDPASFFLEKIPMAAGYALPFDVGINFSTSWFSLGVVGRNILGTYNMTSFDNINSFYPVWSDVFGNKDFQIETPWSIDAGIGFKWDNAFFKPTLVADIVNIQDFFDPEKFDGTGREFMEHVKVGAELRLLSFLDVRGGLNQGYWSVGAGLDLAIVKVDVAYYWQEFGEKLGDYGLDALSVRVNVGFDR